MPENDRTLRRLVSVWDIAEALMLLSRLPVPQPLLFRGARAAWGYPIAGILIATLPALSAVGLIYIGLPGSVAALLAFGMLIMVTGGLHEDGLADCADGFWGGANRTRRLEIMKDSRVGSYGVLALILFTGLRISLFSTLLSTDMWLGIGAFIAAAAISRAGMPVLMLALPSARPTGLAASVGKIPVATVTTGAAIAIISATVICGMPGIIAAMVAFCGTCLTGYLAHKKIGGHTGDVLGASQQVNETLFMLTVIVMST